MRKIPFAYIGGSATRGIRKEPLRFPEELVADTQGIRVVEDDKRYITPWGTTVPMRVLEIDGAKVIWCPVHNWQKGVGGTQASLQLFYVLHRFGVQYIVLDASVGGIPPLTPWELVVPNDLVAFNDDLSELAVTTESLPVFIRMAELLCPHIHQLLVQAAREAVVTPLGGVMTEGVYVSKSLGRFETSAEVQIISHWREAIFDNKPTILGESLGLDAEGARRIGAHAAELCLVANYAEGTSPNRRWWVEEGRANFYQRCPPLVAPIMLKALRLLIKNPPTTCHCRFYWEEAVTTSYL